jgi:hypothetical protein
VSVWEIFISCSCSPGSIIYPYPIYSYPIRIES